MINKLIKDIRKELLILPTSLKINSLVSMKLLEESPHRKILEKQPSSDTSTAIGLAKILSLETKGVIMSRMYLLHSLLFSIESISQIKHSHGLPYLLNRLLIVVLNALLARDQRLYSIISENMGFQNKNNIHIKIPDLILNQNNAKKAKNKEKDIL